MLTKRHIRNLGGLLKSKTPQELREIYHNVLRQMGGTLPKKEAESAIDLYAKAFPDAPSPYQRS